MSIKIRQAVVADAIQIAEIYRPIVESTAISFEIVPPSVDEISARITSVLHSHEWIVAVDSDDIAGYAYASQYRSREAFRFATETTVYIHENSRGKGIGKVLYSALLDTLKTKGFRRAYAAIAIPNDGSIALHKAAGFTEIGTFAEAGFKFDRWHDVSWWERRI